MRFSSLDDWLYSLHSYGPYLFEILFVVAVYFITRKNQKGLWFFPNWRGLAFLPVFLGAGSLLCWIILKNDIFVPFQVQEREQLFLLLLGGPVVEEFVFRMALWGIFEKLARSDRISWAFTSLIFSYGHLHAIWSVPEQFKPFIIWQTVYTLFLGISLGAFKLRSNSIYLPILSHVAFNVGFAIILLISF